MRLIRIAALLNYSFLDKSMLTAFGHRKVTETAVYKMAEKSTIGKCNIVRSNNDQNLVAKATDLNFN